MMKPGLFFCAVVWCLGICVEARGQQKPDAAAEIIADWTNLFEKQKAELRKPVDDLAQKYQAALDRLKTDYTKEGNLDAVLAVTEAGKALAGGDADSPSKDAGVEKLRAIYLKQRPVVYKQITPQLQKIVQGHMEKLEAMIVPLTQRGKLDEAKALARQHDDLKALLATQTPAHTLSDEAVGALLRPGVKRERRLVIWGRNDNGQSLVPKDVTDVMAAHGGGSFSVAVKPDGTVLAWGDNAYGQCTPPAGLSGVIDVACGERHVIALKSDGTVVAWGQDNDGACKVPPGLSGVTAIASQTWFNAALKSDGTVVAWGRSSKGQLAVPAGLSHVTAIAVGNAFGLALKSDGTVVAWGDNENGPKEVPAGLSNVVAIAAGHFHALALKSDGSVVAWGFNNHGQCTIPAGLSKVTGITADGWHSAAIKSDGTVVAWGMAGDGLTKTPEGLTDVKALTSGTYHLLAITEKNAAHSSINLTRRMLLKIRVDGDDTIKIQSKGLWIEHGSWQNPSAITINGVAWKPEWEGKKSQVFREFDPPLAPFGGHEVTAVQTSGRGTTTVLQQPSTANEKTLVIHVKDEGMGADNYVVEIKW